MCRFYPLLQERWHASVTAFRLCCGQMLSKVEEKLKSRFKYLDSLHVVLMLNYAK